MHKYKLFKVFDYDLIPKDISVGYKPCHGCTIQVTVDDESVYPEVRALSIWLITHEAENKEKIFIFRN